MPFAYGGRLNLHTVFTCISKLAHFFDRAFFKKLVATSEILFDTKQQNTNYLSAGFDQSIRPCLFLYQNI